MDKNKATAIIEETFDKAFNKQSFMLFIQNLLNDIDILDKDENATDAFQDHVSRYTHIANYYTPDGETVDILTVEVRDDNKLDKARTSLRNFVVDYLTRINHNYALVAYYAKSDKGSKWRFSFIKIEYLTSVEGGKIKHQNEYTPAKRYSFVLGEDRYNRTAKERFMPILANDYDNPTIKQIEDAFSVEALTKQFYTELFDWYLWALQDETAVLFPEGKKEEHIIRLITRLMFVWFLKQKKSNENSLVPDEIFDIEYLNEILSNFEPNSKQSGNYYNAILQNLFFATLNRQIIDEVGKKRAFAYKSNNENSIRDDFYAIKTLFRDDNVKSWFKISHNKVIDLFSKVPFLNGGLFECLDKIDETQRYKPMLYFDGFSRDNQNKQGKTVRTFIPNHLFFIEKETVVLKKYDYNNSKKKWIDRQKEVSGLIIILKRYNFTIEENTPSDIDVALDPELLGKVFENLLGAFNDETKESARKQSGSFYTPREIVNYMTNESLIAYLNHQVGEEWQQKKEETKQALFECKILDPACGSGAFPMGILNKIIDILKIVEPEINIHETKLNLIENCIYGVDIQPIAVQIAKLRFFISLICEQTPNNNPNDNYGIIPLPNLESKFIAADTLIHLNTEQKDRLNLEDSELRKMKNDLWNIRNHKNLRASSWQQKKKIRKEDKDLCKNIENYLLVNSVKPDLEKIEQNKLFIRQFETQITELPEDWVDTGNLQSSLFGNEYKTQFFQIDRNKEKRDDLIKRIQFCKKEIEKEERKTTLTGLEAETHKMVSWNPYDQNAISPFFDPEWMFGLTRGFDIVIGNPPYIKEGRISKDYFKKYNTSNYYQGKMDIWYMFACHAIDLLKEKGNLCFIATNNWVTNSGASKLRNKVILDTQIFQMLDFGNFMIFESASIQTMVMLFVKNNTLDLYNFDYRKLSGDTIKSDASDLLIKQSNDKAIYLIPSIIRDKYRDKFLTFTSNSIDLLLNKIKEKGVFFEKDDMTNGIHSHFDFVNGQGIFGLTNAELQSLKLSKDEMNLIKPYYTTDQIHRYYSENKNILWLIYTDSSFKNPNSMNNYPNLKKHLDEFANIITSDNKPYGLHRARKEHFFKGEKVFVQRKCVGKPSFSYSDFDCYVSATFYVIQTNRFNHKYLTGLLNSTLIAFWLKFKGKMQGENYQLDKEPLMQIPIYQPTDIQQQPIITIVDYILLLKQMQNDSIIPIYYEIIIDACVYELYFSEEVYAVKKGIIEHLHDLKPIKDNMTNEQKLALINSEFERLYDPYHPVRNNVETIENIESIRIIKSSVQ